MPVMPMDGIRVLDLTRYTAGPFCTRVLGDYGADVIKIEPPEGDPARFLPPFYQDTPGLDHSGLFLFLNTNKRSVVLNLKTAEGRESLLRLAESADAVVENFRPGTLERLELGYETLRARNPRIVLTSISNFGQDGPYRDFEGTDLTLNAMGGGGTMWASGFMGFEPLRYAGHVTTFYAGYVAALASAIALWAAHRTGVGEHVDVSIAEAATHASDGGLNRLLYYQYTGRVIPRPELNLTIGGGVYPCADGLFLFQGGIRGIDREIQMIGREDLLADFEWSTLEGLSDPERIAEFQQYLLPWALDKTRFELRGLCQQYGVLGAPINTTADLMADENYKQRGFFQSIDHPSTGALTYPGYHFNLHFTDGQMPERRRAPLLGEHNREVLDKKGGKASASLPPKTVPTGIRSALPLAGLRILDFTVVLAGQYAAMQLADWGAEVIRVESLRHFAAISRGTMARPSREFVRSPPPLWGLGYIDDEPGEDPWNRFSGFNHPGRNRKSVTLDLTSPEGWSTFERLVAVCDGLVENNMPTNIEKLGIDWERLSRVNPNLIMVRMPGFGLSGPYREFRAMGNHMEAMAGHPSIRMYPGASVDYIPNGFIADAAAGIGGASAFMMGLWYREQTGKGVLVEHSSAENFVPFLGDFILDLAMNGRVWSQMGNDHFWLAPHNAYRCAGEDNWVAVTCRSEDEWRRLCDVMCREDLLQDERFRDIDRRYANRRDLDKIISEWAIQRDRYWIMNRLQQVGVPAGIVVTEADVYESPQHKARGFFQPIAHPSAGTHMHIARAWKASATPDISPRHAPLLGQDNEYVYKELLGFTDDEYRHYEEIGQVGSEYAASVL